MRPRSGVAVVLLQDVSWCNSLCSECVFNVCWFAFREAGGKHWHGGWGRAGGGVGADVCCRRIFLQGRAKEHGGSKNSGVGLVIARILVFLH